MDNDRRRFQRVKLREPLRGVVGPARVFVLDASVGGLRVAHQGTLPPPGAFCRVELPTDMGPVTVDCEVVRTVPQPATQTQQKPVYQSGLAVIATADRQSAERLRSIFAAAAAKAKTGNGN